MEAKRAAAVAAVYSYLALVKAGAGGQAAGAQPGGAGAQPSGAGAQPSGAGAQPGPSLWALYGRQALMNQRIRMQTRRRA